MTQTVRRIPTSLGEIAVANAGGGDGVPAMFLHGIYLDRSLWDDVIPADANRPLALVDMPGHGESGEVGRPWNLDECAAMVGELLDALAWDRGVLVGHSWGAMTALRVAAQTPARVAALGLFNMPFRRQARRGRIGFRLQKLLVSFPSFYGRRAAKALYTPALLARRPELAEAMRRRLSRRPPSGISRAIDAVLMEPGDAAPLLARRTVPTLAVVGQADYVGPPPGVETRVVPGGHISPHEAPAETRDAISAVLALADAGDTGG